MGLLVLLEVINVNDQEILLEDEMRQDEKLCKPTSVLTLRSRNGAVVVGFLFADEAKETFQQKVERLLATEYLQMNSA